ncbi:MAG: RnfABCDGE type electron transport complex subunit D [Myxococcota bacterium]|nr:RnfABCDGE type electron transport complex subunit D [Myxococcota bacterium]
MRDQRYIVSPAPHLRHGRTIRTMMLTTIAALAPAALWGVYQFGLRSLFLIEIGIGAALATELAVCKMRGIPHTLGDFHAVLVGLTVALLVPAGVPWWLVLIGAVLAVLLGKVIFGPLGGSPISPALVGLLIIAASWPAEISTYRAPRSAAAAWHAEGIAPPKAPLDAVAQDPSDINEYTTSDLFLGHQAGPMGAVSPLLLIIGGLFLIWRRVARWQAPLAFIVGLASAAAIGHALDPWGCPPMAFHLFTGAAMFGAFFLCTDFSSTPVTPIGLVVFGLIAGALSLLLRQSGMPYGPVPWAIALTSLTTPLLDRISLRRFGKVVTHAG